LNLYIHSGVYSYRAGLLLYFGEAFTLRIYIAVYINIERYYCLRRPGERETERTERRDREPEFTSKETARYIQTGKG
jgi:hypothetical protein